jgi:hypothetical protein
MEKYIARTGIAEGECNPQPWRFFINRSSGGNGNMKKNNT